MLGSLPTWERELKQRNHIIGVSSGVSLPTWERELKHNIIGDGVCITNRSLRGSVS